MWTVNYAKELVCLILLGMIMTFGYKIMSTIFQKEAGVK